MVDLMTTDGWQELFAQSAPARGGVDFHIMSAVDLGAYSAAFGLVTGTALNGAQSPAFSEICILLPVGSSEEGTSFEADLVNRLREMCKGVVASDRVEMLLKVVRKRLRIVPMLEHEVEPIVAYVAALPIDACVLVLRGERLNSPAVPRLLS